MIARMLSATGILALAVGSCEATSRPPERDSGSASVEVEQPNPEPHDGEPPLAGSMAGQACPSASLPRFSTQLDAAGWTRLRSLADERVVAVALAERVELIEACRLPGRYHEAVAAPDSPGRAWSSDRLVLLPDEAQGCDRATHFVASFAIRGDADGEAIVLPLPCPPLGSGATATGCIGAGLDDAGRKAKAEPLWTRARPLLVEAEMDRALPLVLDVTALIPDAWGHMALLDALRPLDHGSHGGCLWLSEAAFAVQFLAPDHEISIVDISQGRIAPSHDYPKCDTRPSLLTCFPERFSPGVGDNSW